MLDPSRPAQNNGYNYGANNPITNVDPDGKSFLSSIANALRAIARVVSAIHHVVSAMARHVTSRQSPHIAAPHDAAASTWVEEYEKKFRAADRSAYMARNVRIEHAEKAFHAHSGRRD